MTSDVLFVVVLIVVVVGIVIWIATVSARAKRISAASDARLAAQLQAIADNPPATKPFDQETPAERSEQVIEMAHDDDETPAQIVASTKEERLTELSALHSKGSITDDELATARAKILAE
jgi:flagellar biosynthesis/type III secretory pathway M-ring protein FliF/YscJ